MQRFWICLTLLALLSQVQVSARASQLEECRQNLRAEVFDNELLIACEVLMNHFEARQKTPDERMIKLVAASNRVRSNVLRCERLYGAVWAKHWAKIQGSLGTTYRLVITDINSTSDSDLCTQAFKSVNQDISWLNLHELLTASATALR